MADLTVHQCQCAHCRQSQSDSDQTLHQQMNLFLSRLDEQQRRWFVALESKRIGHGGDHLLAQMTGLDEKTMRRGRRELDQSLTTRPAQRVRLPGAGRPLVEKKTQP